MSRLFVSLFLLSSLHCAAQCRQGSVTESSGAVGYGELCKVKVKPTYGAAYSVDVKSGEWRFNNENNVLYSKGRFEKKGEYSSKEGIWAWYSEDGVAFAKVLFVNDRPKKIFTLDTGLAVCGNDSVKVSTSNNNHFTTIFCVNGLQKQWVADNVVEEFNFEQNQNQAVYNPVKGIIGVKEELDKLAATERKDNIIWTDREIMELHIPEVKRLLTSDTGAISTEKNLVENPGFRADKKQIPDGFYSLSKSMLPGWFPAVESPDLLVSENKACIGFRTAGINYEVVRGRLKQPLEKNKKYCFSMRIKLKYDNNYTTNNVGVLISKNVISTINRDNAAQNGILVLSPDNVPPALRDSWMTVKGSFKAEGDETHLYFGQFSTGKKIKYWPLDSIYNGTSGEIYFYFKDPALYELGTGLPCSCTSEQCDSTATEEPKDEVLVFQNVQFKTGDWKLLETSFSALDSLYEYLSSKTNFTLEIVGHTDNQGDAAQNFKLSEKRAKAVYDYLIKAGADKTRLKYTGKGDSMPIADNDEEEGRMANRRVEFHLKQP